MCNSWTSQPAGQSMRVQWVPEENGEQETWRKPRVWSRRFYFFPRLNLYHKRGNRGRGEVWNIYTGQAFVWSTDVNRMLGFQKGYRFVISLVSRMLVSQKGCRSCHWASWLQMYFSARSQLHHIIIHPNHHICISLLQLAGDFPWT